MTRQRGQFARLRARTQRARRPRRGWLDRYLAGASFGRKFVVFVALTTTLIVLRTGIAYLDEPGIDLLGTVPRSLIPALAISIFAVVLRPWYLRRQEQRGR